MIDRSDIDWLLKYESGTRVVGSVPDRVREKLECSSGVVSLRGKEARHIIDKHKDFDEFKLLLIPVAIRTGFYVQQKDRRNSVTSLFIDPFDERKYQLAMKTAENGHELWVCSMYRLTAHQWEARHKWKPL